MKNDDTGCFAVVLGIVLVVIAAFLTKWFVTAVLATDWPDWVKFMILVR